MATYRIHPGIGIARLGNSETEFYIAPETPAEAQNVTAEHQVVVVPSPTPTVCDEARPLSG